VEDSRGAEAVRNLGGDLAKARMAVEFILGHGDRPVVGEMGLTPAAKRVIELAIDEARRLDHHYVGTEHLLLGLVREGDGIAAGVLESLGIDLDKLRQEVIRLVGEGPSATRSRRQPMPAVPIPLAVDEASHALEVSRWYWEIGASPLRRVVGIGQVIDDAGIAVEFIALEIRGAGCVLYWKARPIHDRLLGAPDGALRDDVGTDYSLRFGGWSGSDHEAKGEILLVPAPPDTAVTMLVDFTRFAVPRWSSTTTHEDVRGTWHFEFAVHG
jgi:hypothetical protein